MHSWVKGIADSLEYFGGVPVILRPDNTRTATIKADRYEPDLNATMVELSEHYGTVIIPARVRKPRDKNVVENSVAFASTYIIAALRNQVFYSLDEINDAVSAKVEELNSEPFRRRKAAGRSCSNTARRNAFCHCPQDASNCLRGQWRRSHQITMYSSPSASTVYTPST